MLASVADPALSAMTADRQLTAARVRRRGGGAHGGACASAPAEVLERLGVDVIDAEPEHLPVALTDHYLLLKSRGLL